MHMLSAIHQYVAVNLWSEGGFRQRRSPSATYVCPALDLHCTPWNIWTKPLQEWQHSKLSLLSLKLSLTPSCPALDPPRADLIKSLNTCAGHENFIPTKFHKHPSSGPVVKDDYVCVPMYKCTLPLPSPK